MRFMEYKHHEVIVSQSGFSVKRSKNPNERFIRKIIREDLRLFKLLATNAKKHPERHDD